MPSTGKLDTHRKAPTLLSGIDLEWTETKEYFSAEQLRFEPPLDHLYAYLLTSDSLVPMRIPAKAGGVSGA